MVVQKDTKIIMRLPILANTFESLGRRVPPTMQNTTTIFPINLGARRLAKGFRREDDPWYAFDIATENGYVVSAY